MDFYVCLNETFGYCSDKPEYKDGFCAKDCKTCGNYITLVQSAKAQLNRAKAQMGDTWTQHKPFVQTVAYVDKLKVKH